MRIVGLCSRLRKMRKSPLRPLQVAVTITISGLRTNALVGKGVVLDKKSIDNRSPKEIAAAKRERAAADGKSAMAEHAARQAFVEKNTIRLRELRLAKEAAEREALLTNPPPAKAVKTAKRSSRT